MDFAKRELIKYGWKEGKGLGKESTGIVEPMRPKLKFDNKGLGFNHGEEYSFKWWEYVYNNTAANISVNSAEDGTKTVISTKIKKPNQISIKKGGKGSKKLNGKKKYNNFSKEELLDDLRINCRMPSSGQKMNDTSNEGDGELRGKLARLLSQENQFLLNQEKIFLLCESLAHPWRKYGKTESV